MYTMQVVHILHLLHNLLEYRTLLPQRSVVGRGVIVEVYAWR